MAAKWFCDCCGEEIPISEPRAHDDTYRPVVRNIPIEVSIKAFVKSKEEGRAYGDVCRNCVKEALMIALGIPFGDASA